jgi:putative methionine-R-sulfoxide reductase with GAF domain
MPDSTDAALAKIEAIVGEGGDADVVLRDVVAALHDDAGYPWAGIFFVEDGALALGPHAGTPHDTTRTAIPVTWNGDRIAELAIDDAPEEDRMFLERVASLVADHCLVGWDTGGESWEP